MQQVMRASRIVPTARSAAGCRTSRPAPGLVLQRASAARQRSRLLVASSSNDALHAEDDGFSYTSGASASGSSSSGTTPSPATSPVPVPVPSSTPSQSPTPHTSSPTPSPKPSPRKIGFLKSRLLAAVASLDRGLAANAREAQDVDDLCTQLESAGGRVDLHHSPSQDHDQDLLRPDDASSYQGSARPDKLAGMWRLVYTSGFNTGSLGGRRPGPPAALVPSTLGQVFQRIDASTGKLDNIVELIFAVGLPDITAALMGQAQPRRDTPTLRLTLRHDYEVQGTGTVQIVYVDTAAELVGSSLFRNLPRFDFPNVPEPFRPPRFLRSAKFEVTFLDDAMRITRGDRGELRIYLRDSEADLSAAGGAWASEDDE